MPSMFDGIDIKLRSVGFSALFLSRSDVCMPLSRFYAISTVTSGANFHLS